MNQRYYGCTVVTIRMSQEEEESSLSNSDTMNFEKSRQISNDYRKLFQDVPFITSNELVSLIQQRHEKKNNFFLIVDVRSSSEQSISMIPGSIPLTEFQQQQLFLLPTTQKPMTVIFYCTVGYRSGMTARYYQDKYSSSIQVKNLDGIVAYTHAISNYIHTEENKSIYMLKNPNTHVNTNKVHCYGKTWNYVDSHFEPVFFNSFHFLWKTLGVGILTLWRSFQHLLSSIHFYISLSNQR